MLGISAIAVVALGPQDARSAAPPRAECATPAAARAVQARDRHDLDAAEVERMLGGIERRRAPIPSEITVPVRFHVLTDGVQGRLSGAAVGRQIDVLNAAYGGLTGGADTGVRFQLASLDTTVHSGWFTRPHAFEAALKSRLRRGDSRTLNLYTAAVGQDVLGFSTFPQWRARKPVHDGVVIDFRSLPGGDYPNFGLGYTAVHEVGHWLGLFHTFENGCVAPGDGVDDTPAEGVATEGCPPNKNTCPSPGSDPVRNFMDYSWDECMSEFTPGQGLRIREAWAAYRLSPL